VLGAGALVELEVLVDLRLALALGGLVDGELDEALAIADHLGHEGRVLGRDVVVGEVDHLGHREDVLVVLDPGLHRAELDVADDVVDGQQHPGVLEGVLDGGEAGEEGSVVAVALDEGVQCVAVSPDRGNVDRAMLVAELLGLGDADGAASGGLAIGVLDARHAEGDHAYPVAVLVLMGGDRGIGVQRAGQHEADAPLLQDVGDLVARAGLQAAVGDAPEAERVRVVVRGLQRVAHVELNVVNAVERHVVVIWDRRGDGRRRGLLGHAPSSSFVRGPGE
jgi:hypothetical protein